MTYGRIVARAGLTVLLVACATLATWLLLARAALRAPETVFGVTFSPSEARYQGVDAGQAWYAVLDDLQARLIRFPLYWSQIERTPGAYDFSDAAWYLDEAAKRGAKVTLVVGLKVPRWPECHAPAWVGDGDRREALLAYMEAAVLQFKDHPALYRWQVENEPHFPFGVCPAPDLVLVQDEVVLVRRLDPDTPIQLTVSGENEPWIASAAAADVLGASLYRFAWNPQTGLVVFPQSPSFYALQAASVARYTDRVVISELQAEPWFADGTRSVAVEEQYALFPEERLREHLAYGRATGLPEVYLWGVEWWYALREKGETRLWDAAQEAIRF